jgi:putative ABC transport system permease protein
VQVEVARPDGEGPGPGGVAPKLTDPQTEAMLRSLPGTALVTASAMLPVRQVGTSQETTVRFYRGDSTGVGFRVLDGHWMDGPGQIAVSERFLQQRGLAVGDTITLELNGKRTQVRIVAEVLLNNGDLVLSNWETLTRLDPKAEADWYEIKLDPGTDIGAYLAEIGKADPGLHAFPSDTSSSFIAIVLVTVTLLTLMLGTVAALGVFNTVVLNTRERRRDLGMLKSIGMTPRQVTTMVVTSMAALGAVGGLIGIPLGIVAHRLVVPAMAQAAQVDFPDFVINVYGAPLLALLLVAGIAIAALGAFIPARSASRATIAHVLHNE